MRKGLRPGEIRYVVRVQNTPSGKVWSIYDRSNGSWPYILDGRKVAQEHIHKHDAQLVADVLNSEIPE